MPYLFPEGGQKAAAGLLERYRKWKDEFLSSGYEYSNETGVPRLIPPVGRKALLGAGEFLLGGEPGSMQSLEGNLLGMVNPMMTVYHGSPYKFDKFLKEKIGTGEGAQAYGHGLYFAENPDVAKQYANVLGNNTVSYVGNTKDTISRLLKAGVENAEELAYFAYEGGFEGGTQKQLKSFMRKFGGKKLADEVDRPGVYEAILDYTQPRSKNLYHVDLPDSVIDKMLDWDKPISEQGSRIQKLLSGISKVEPTDGMNLAGGGKLRIVDDPDFGRKYFLEMSGKRFQLRENELTNLIGTGVEGRSVYQALSTKLGGDKAASEYLHSLGIPGIRYLDAGSRGSGQGTRNFVVFNPDDVKILERK